MILKTYKYVDKNWNEKLDEELDSKNTLVLVFGDSNKENIQDALNEILNAYPLAKIVGASTAGEIFQDEIYEESLVVSVMKFQTTTLKLSICSTNNKELSYQGGIDIANNLNHENLKAVFVICDGLNINGSQFVKGINKQINKNVLVTGGLSADGSKFKSTWVIADKKIQTHKIVAVGLYGDNINIQYGMHGGWDNLGIKRVVTKSKDNIVYELDGVPALDLYKKYLGAEAKNLPASGLYFPLEIQPKTKDEDPVVRAIMSVNEEDSSITFAGDIPESSVVTLMKANLSKLISGASQTSKGIDLSRYKGEDILNIAVSCVGRKLVLKQRIEDELDATLYNLPKETKQIGFYSYGEISPSSSGMCNLHNHTMVITVLWESDA